MKNGLPWARSWTSSAKPVERRVLAGQVAQHLARVLFVERLQGEYGDIVAPGLGSNSGR